MKLDMSKYDDMRLDWISKDVVVKFLSIFYPLKCMKTGRQHYQMKQLGRRQNEKS